MEETLRRLALLLLLAGCRESRLPSTDWPTTGGGPANTRYSPLDQINTTNVGRLRVAWTFHTGDLPKERGEIQATPIVIDGIMYTTTPALAVVALHAENGKQIWRFDPRTTPHAPRTDMTHVNRGVVYWADTNDRRIFFTAGRRLYALDARTGHPISTFGDSGSIDLAVGLSRDIGDAYLVATSPGAIYRDLLIQGQRVGEDEGSAPGDVRAYDVRSGAIRWTFHTVPQPGEFGHDTWPPDAWRTAGGANSWAGMSVDTSRGVVYVPTGSATPDFYGGDRLGANLFANSLIALDAMSGKRLWHFQTVHHDIWDRDLPAAPNLVTVTRAGNRVDAAAQITKSGFVFVFDRQTGKPLFDVVERRVPASDLAGERASATQPMPVKPAPFARQSITEADVTDLGRYSGLNRGGFFTPPSRSGSIVLPGFDGGGEWGGAAVDPESAVIYVNASDIPWIAAMRESARILRRTGPPRSGAAVYAEVCATCHSGAGRGPSLANVAQRRTYEETRGIIDWGRGFMPSFAGLPVAERRAVLQYIGYPVTADTAASAWRRTQGSTSRYEFVGYERWRDSSGYPAVKPPWGTLSAIDLNTGEYRWRIPLGEFTELKARGIPPTGTELYGGPIVTAGGLVFIAASQDAKFRAFDKHNGAMLWEADLPAPGYATPSTYAVNGTQFVVIAAGGGKLGSKSSDTYVAFALP